MITGYATPEGTKKFAEKQNENTQKNYKNIQNLTLSMDAGTDGGGLRASGQFMTGYKPIIEANSVTADTSASDYDGGLFHCDTSTLGTDAMTVKSFELTISNPAQRVGYQGTAGEADGYIRAGQLDISGSVTMKADSLQQVNADTFWKENATAALVLKPSSASSAKTIDFNLPAVNVSDVSMDMGEEGIFQTVSFTCTAGAETGNLAVLKAT